jgi:DNA polymerase-1
MLLQIHDELVIEAPSEAAVEVTGLVRDAMEGVVEMAVPLVVDVASGDSLDAVKA